MGRTLAGFLVLVLGALATLAGTRTWFCNQISQRCIVQNSCRSIAHIEKNLIQRAVRQIAVNQFAQLFGVAETVPAVRQSGG